MGGMGPYIRFTVVTYPALRPFVALMEGTGQLTSFKGRLYRGYDLRERQGVRLTGRS
jgi:hypothetical protein